MSAVASVADRLAGIVSGGDVTVASSTEGIEGAHVVLSGGTVDVTATDDGLNAASDTVDPVIAISDGTITIDSGGDGTDANGTVTISGGDITVAGPLTEMEGALDADTGLFVSGGTLIAAGNTRNGGRTGEESDQGWLQVGFDNAVSAGSVVAVLDADGEELATTTLTKVATNLVVSTGGIDADEDYTVTVDGDEVASVTSGVSVGNDRTGGPGGAGGGPGGEAGEGPPEGMAPPEGVTPPEGMTPPEVMAPPDDAPSAQ